MADVKKGTQNEQKATGNDDADKRTFNGRVFNGTTAFHQGGREIIRFNGCVFNGKTEFVGKSFDFNGCVFNGMTGFNPNKAGVDDEDEYSEYSEYSDDDEDDTDDYDDYDGDDGDDDDEDEDEDDDDEDDDEGDDEDDDDDEDEEGEGYDDNDEGDDDEEDDEHDNVCGGGPAPAAARGDRPLPAATGASAGPSTATTAASVQDPCSPVPSLADVAKTPEFKSNLQRAMRMLVYTNVARTPLEELRQQVADVNFQAFRERLPELQAELEAYRQRALGRSVRVGAPDRDAFWREVYKEGRLPSWTICAAIMIRLLQMIRHPEQYAGTPLEKLTNKLVSFSSTPSPKPATQEECVSVVTSASTDSH